MMKPDFLIVSALLLLLPAGCTGKDNGPQRPDRVEMEFVQTDPLVKIMKEDRSISGFDEAADAAKGETVSFQLVFRSNVPVSGLKIEPGNLKCGGTEIPYSVKAFEKYIRGGLHLGPAADDAILPVSDEYPDQLDECETVDVPANFKQPVWVTYRIPREIPAGDYEAEIAVSGTDAGLPVRMSLKVKAKIWDVVLPEKQSLLVSNWHVHRKVAMISTGGSTHVFSDAYWEAMKEAAHSMRDHGQNVYFINPLSDFFTCTQTGDSWTFDFANFDKTVELFLKEGNLAAIEGGHLAFRSSDWDSDYWVDVPLSGRKPLSDPAARSFLANFVPALKSHLIEKGWWDIYLQHIGDEPAGGAVRSYVEIAQYVRSLAPDIRILDAVHSRELANTVDVWCPQLDYFDSDYSFYKSRQAAGDEIWFYTCMAPRGNYANRFLENPLLKVRILHWLNYRYEATGYLHWGWNQVWENALANVATEGYCPAGDMFIVYPGKGKVHSSIRFEAMRDGIADYELLKLLESKNPGRAMDIAKSVVKDFDVYDTDTGFFRETRRTLLKELTK